MSELQQRSNEVEITLTRQITES